MQRFWAVALTLVSVQLANAQSMSAQPVSAQALEPADWQAITQAARGQTVYFNAWGGAPVINDYIRWAGEQVSERYGIELEHVRVADISEVVARVLAEKTAGREQQGRVDLMWINGDNFRAMKDNELLFGPWTHWQPNYQYVDLVGKPTVLFDFSTQVDNLESPWGMAQLVFQYDSARIEQPPRSMLALLDFAKQHPGRVTYPLPPAFHGTTFIKQALLELVEDRAPLYQPVQEADFAAVTAPLWQFLDQLHPLMWQQGRRFPSGAPQMTQMLADGDIFIGLSFNPNDASNAIANGELPDTVRTYVHDAGTLGNTHFLAIPFNAANKEAAMVLSNFLLSPEAQAHKADVRVWGDPTVLAIDLLPQADQQRFAELPLGVATLSPQELGAVLPEPHASWVDALNQAWLARYSR